MLALFRPWSRSSEAPLKDPGQGWSDALTGLLATLGKDKLLIIDHMQEQWECKLAADLYSERRAKRFAGYRSSQGFMSVQDIADDLANDIDWQIGQSTEAEDPEYNEGIGVDSDDLDYQETCATQTQDRVEDATALATAAGFYGRAPVPDDVANFLHGEAVDVGHEGRYAALEAAQRIANERKVFLERRKRGEPQCPSIDWS